VDLNTVREVVPVADDAGLRAWQAARRIGDVVLAGGTWVFSEPQPRARRLVDVTCAGWPALTEREEGLEVAATATIAELAGYRPSELAVSASVRRLVQQCCEALVGSFKVWNVATVGGNLCLSLPAGPVTSLAAALDGSCTVWTPGGGLRRVPALHLVTGDGTNVLAPGDVLRAVLLPAEALASRVTFRRASLSPLGRSAALVVGRRTPDLRTAVTMTAATRRPVRVVVPGDAPASVLHARIGAAVPEGLWHDDVHGLPAWRRHLTHLFAEQVHAELAEAAP
jgi:CO/xanthine dehydrogenase FAD-binding subunit